MRFNFMLLAKCVHSFSLLPVCSFDISGAPGLTGGCSTLVCGIPQLAASASLKSRLRHPLRWRQDNTSLLVST